MTTLKKLEVRVTTLEQHVKKLEQTRKARIANQRRVQDEVMVNGKRYNSTWAAFQALGLDEVWGKKHEPFRRDLKNEREMIIEHDGTEHHFHVVTRRVSVNDY